jgi:glucose-1-phosphate thymidylyltransferase
MSKKYQGIVISAPEEIAYINGFIDKEKLMESVYTARFERSARSF